MRKIWTYNISTLYVLHNKKIHHGASDNPCKTSIAFNVLIIDSISVLISLLEKFKKTHEKFHYFNVLNHLIHKE